MRNPLLILLFFSSIIWAQQSTGIENLKGKVASFESETYKVKDDVVSQKSSYIFVKLFNTNNIVSKIKYLKEDKTLDSEEIFTYQSDGKILKIETLKPDGRINKTTTFEYNIFNQLFVEQKLNYKYDVESQSTYLYNDNQQLISKEQSFSKINYTTIDRYLYNDQNQLAEISKEDSSGITREVYTYYPDGALFTKDEFNSKNEKFSSILYEYNNQGDKISLFKFDISGELTYFEQYEYRYDTIGNWIEKKSFIKGDLTSIEKRIFVYY